MLFPLTSALVRPLLTSISILFPNTKVLVTFNESVFFCFKILIFNSLILFFKSKLVLLNPKLSFLSTTKLLFKSSNAMIAYLPSLIFSRL